MCGKYSVYRTSTSNQVTLERPVHISKTNLPVIINTVPELANKTHSSYVNNTVQIINCIKLHINNPQTVNNS
jgi:hypothetical protein